MTDNTNDRDLGRLEGKMDSVITLLQSYGLQIKAIEERISTLENFKSYLLGAVAIFSLIGGAAWTFFTNLLTSGKHS